MCAEKGTRIIRPWLQRWKTSSFVFKALVSVQQRVQFKTPLCETVSEGGGSDLPEISSLEVYPQELPCNLPLAVSWLLRACAPLRPSLGALSMLGPWLGSVFNSHFAWNY